ncbi:MAG: response regulator [Planctomycetaceae bacterium]|jgi:CheY-like chemotaxis protein|nr:response regulator [Planctomycetaceae bacterium]
MAQHTILLVEKDADARADLNKLLSANGFAVTEAENAAEAEELAAKGKFNLVISDLMLENADGGFTLSYHFKRDYPAVPVILLSRAINEMDIVFSRESQSERNWIKADALLNQPVRFEQLLATVQKLLHIMPKHAH